MKRILTILLGSIVGFVLGFIVTIHNIKIDAINEVDNGIVTIKVFNIYFDYYYETE